MLTREEMECRQSGVIVVNQQSDRNKIDQRVDTEVRR